MINSVNEVMNQHEWINYECNMDQELSTDIDRMASYAFCG